MNGYTETRTQEDLAEIQAIHFDQFGGCKNCQARVEFGDWHSCTGDAYCGRCADMLRRECGSRPVKLPTRTEQAAELYANATTEYAQGRRDGVMRCWINGCGTEWTGAGRKWTVKPLDGSDKGIRVCLDHAMTFGHTGQYECRQH